MRNTLDPDSMGPVDVAVIGFTGDRFDGSMAPALAELVASGTIRVIDLAFARKSAEGDTEWIEVADAEISALSELDDPEQDLLNDEDLMLIAESLEPATAAMVVVWENTWAAPLVSAMRNAGGTLLARDHIPHEIVANAIAALEG